MLGSLAIRATEEPTMKTLILACTLAGGLVLAPLAAAQDAPPHEHGHATTPVPAAAPEGGWATDAPLREGMARVRGALDELRHYEMGHMPRGLAVEKVGEVKDAVSYMFAHCRLKADADAALHDMLVPLLAAVQRFESDPSDAGSIAAMRAAVADYPRLFDDPAARPAAGDAGQAHDGPQGGERDG
jgi:hypothetical protein